MSMKKRSTESVNVLMVSPETSWEYVLQMLPSVLVNSKTKSQSDKLLEELSKKSAFVKSITLEELTESVPENAPTTKSPPETNSLVSVLKDSP